MVRGGKGSVSVFQWFSTGIGSALILAGGWALCCRSIGLGLFRGFSAGVGGASMLGCRSICLWHFRDIS